jgi:hypothetical protein
MARFESSNEIKGTYLILLPSPPPPPLAFFVVLVLVLFVVMVHERKAEHPKLLTTIPKTL